MFIKFFLACALLLSVSIDISLIRYGEYKDFDASKKDKIAVNRPYMGRLEYDEQWGFSTRSISRNFRLLG